MDAIKTQKVSARPIEEVIVHPLVKPVLVIIDVQPKELGIPIKVYRAVEEVKEITESQLHLIVFHELLSCPRMKTNDMMSVIYLASLIRSVITLHNLMNNKMVNKEHEKAEGSNPSAVPAAAGS
ncbi:MitMem_reg domain-containing protein [Cephalotus follicularis]|uniref:MitMem_reg domain-containing protein n=1 Tax=Cephalotus follicularis TaxID=3775 RepID=A0A1Q3AMM5_CEPFO|nr:MitMem_reg domain-containing protein [Cephalotus follicularis]